jgi:hypothetical protein
MKLVNAVTEPVMQVKTVKAVKQTAVYAATVMPAMYQIVPITIAVQKAGLVMVLKTVKTRLMAVT